MRAHRARVEVTEDHEVRLTLPSDFPMGTAEVLVVITPTDAASAQTRLSVDDLIAARLTPPAGTAPVSLADMERAIADGARGSV